MLQKMVLTNFLSFRERTEFDFTPSKYEFLRDTNVSDNGVLKGAMFVGANASGKTNALRGLAFLIQLINGDPLYFAGYHCIFGGKTLGAEYTFVFSGSTVLYLVEYDTDQQEMRETLTVDGTVVLMRRGARGELRLGDTPIVDEQLDGQTAFLRTASFNTGRFPQNPVLHELMEFLSNSVCVDEDNIRKLEANASKIAEESGVEKLNQYLEAFRYDFSLEYGSESKGMGIWLRTATLPNGQERKVLFFKRREFPVPFTFSRESLGNQVFIGLLSHLIGCIEKPGIVLIDEYGNSLHNRLEEKLLRFFMESAGRSQFFFTSHCTNLMSNSLLRPDQIALVSFAVEEKPEGKVGSSRVKRVSDFSPRMAQNLEKMYLGGMFEGLPNYEEV